MNTTRILAVVSASAGLLTSAVAVDSAGVKEVVIVANDTLKLSVTKIEVAPGQKVHVQLRNEGSMPKATMAHNWVLLKAGQDPARYAAAAMTAAADGYQPKALKDEVLASISPLGPHETGDVTFEAPKEPGHYPYFCSYPAHFAAGMRGELIVK